MRYVLSAIFGLVVHVSPCLANDCLDGFTFDPKSQSCVETDQTAQLPPCTAQHAFNLRANGNGLSCTLADQMAKQSLHERRHELRKRCTSTPKQGRWLTTYESYECELSEELEGQFIVTRKIRQTWQDNNLSAKK